jgi:hypothetical protein
MSVVVTKRILTGLVALPMYGVARKVPILWNAKVCGDYDRDKGEYTKRPLLITEKTGIMMFSALVSPVIAPFWFFDDLKYLETRLRGYDPEKFGFKKDVFYKDSYIFM